MIEKSIFKDGANKNLTHPKNNKGITLISLVITIIILIILAMTSINLILNDGIIQKAEYAVNQYEEAQIREQIELYAVEYQYNTGHIITEDAKNVILNTVLETKLPVDRFIVFHDRDAMEQNELNKDDATYTSKVEEYIFYNWNTATVDEIDKLEKRTINTQPENKLIKDISNRAFIVDLTGDGYVNQKDHDFANLILSISNIDEYKLFGSLYTEEKNEKYFEIFNLEEDDRWVIECYPLLFEFDYTGTYGGFHEQMIIYYIIDDEVNEVGIEYMFNNALYYTER